MRRFDCFAFLLTAVPVLALAQPAGEPYAPPTPPPPDAAPEGQPPPEAPPPPQESQPMAQPSAGPGGQWVETNQYGRVWIPYGQQYTYIPNDPQVYPYQYVYYPVYGWRWIVAPWVYGYGPSPVWGPLGPRYFVWYSRPWFRVGGHWGWGGYRGWGHYRGWIGPRAWGVHGWHAAPTYYHSGVGGPHHPGHAVRAAPPAQRGHERRPPPPRSKHHP